MVQENLTEYLKSAFEYKNEGCYKQAIDYFYKALAIENESAEIMCELASLYEKLCRYDRAVSLYEQILQKDSENNEIKYRLAHVLTTVKDYKTAENLLAYLYNSGFCIEKTASDLFYILIYNRKYDKVIMYFNKYSDILKNSSALYYAAIAHNALGNRHTADEFFKKSFERDEKNILAGIELAGSFLEKGQIDAARQLAFKLLKYTEDARIYYILAEAEFLEGSIDNAVKYYSCAVNISPKKALYHYKLALAFSLKGFFKEAEESFCNAVNLDGSNEDYNYALAYLYYTAGKYEPAERIADFLLEKNEDNLHAAALKVLISAENTKGSPSAKFISRLENAEKKDDFMFYAEAVYYLRLKLFEKAAQAVHKALELKPSAREYKYLLAEAEYKTGKLNEAEMLCEKIIDENPKYIQAYLLLSRISCVKRNFAKAEIFLDKVIKLDKNTAEAYSLQASICFERGQFDRALSRYKTALSISPDNEEYYEKIAACYYNMKRYKDAYLYYKEAAEFNITNAEYRYYAAKCADYTDNIENAASNYSMALRLNPSNLNCIKDYAAFLNRTGKKQTAVKLLSGALKELKGAKAEEIKKLIDEYKIYQRKK